MTRTIQSSTSPESANLVRDFLQAHRSGILATADGAANPHAAVVYYTLDDDYNLRFGTKTETQKYKNIEENKQVAFVVYDEASQTVAQVFGHVEVVGDHDQQQETVNNMVAASAELSGAVTPPAEKLYAGGYAALRLVPQVIKLAVYARPDSQGDDLYETLVFGE